jgi:hypothetical protein
MTRTNDAHFKFDSASTPGLVHTVRYVETDAGWALACDCKAAEYGRTCWHLKAARDADKARAPVMSAAQVADIDAKMARFARA